MNFHGKDIKIFSGNSNVHIVQLGLLQSDFKKLHFWYCAHILEKHEVVNIR